MAVEHEFIRRTKDQPEMILVIRITGGHDIYRFAHHMLRGQVEFAERGRRIIEQLKRRSDPAGWRAFDRSMGGWRMRGEREPKPPKQAVS